MASEGQDRAHALGWGGPNRPKTFARYHTIPQKVTTVSICAKGPGHPEGYPGPIHLQASLFRAAAARHALVLDDLAIKVVLGLDNAAKEHPAVHAGVGAL
jgi:hypothetical protein